MSEINLAWIMGLISVAQLVITIVTLAVHGTRKLAASEQAIQRSLVSSRKELDSHIDGLRREVGETLTAMRQKIQEVELYIRDNYVRRDSFSEVTKRISNEVEAAVGRVELQVAKLENKIDDWRKDDKSE